MMQQLIPVFVSQCRMIVQATGFATTGHCELGSSHVTGSLGHELMHLHTGYTCERGHPYVIDACGGAMEVATCPECGARIGGTSHTLDPTNRNALDLDELAVEAGARREYYCRVRA